MGALTKVIVSSHIVACVYMRKDYIPMFQKKEVEVPKVDENNRPVYVYKPPRVIVPLDKIASAGFTPVFTMEKWAFTPRHLYRGNNMWTFLEGRHHNKQIAMFSR